MNELRLKSTRIRQAFSEKLRSDNKHSYLPVYGMIEIYRRHDEKGTAVKFDTAL